MTRPGRVLGVDPGTTRIGLAVSDPDRLVATPHSTVAGGRGAAQRVKAVHDDLGCVAVVVGLPRSLAGRKTGSTQMAEALADQLRQVGAVVHLHDERLTSVQADRVLRASGKTTRQTKGYKDQVAASVLLQSWLDSRPPTTPTSEPPPP
ncbi:Holliday junction resolvase RuvX [Euzebya sp.]|uniref:Holliday junction resolvase RuvX n=1 Tax=Euzebya sp. TaxID=1971409 RepID=UPI003511A2F7